MVGEKDDETGFYEYECADSVWIYESVMSFMLFLEILYWNNYIRSTWCCILLIMWHVWPVVWYVCKWDVFLQMFFEIVLL